VSFWCSMGPRLLVDNHNTGAYGPDAILVHLPGVGDVIPSRFALGLWFSIAVIFALALDAMKSWSADALRQQLDARASGTSRSQANRRRRVAARGATALALLLGLAIIIPLVPNWPTNQQPASVPAFFTSQDVQTIPAGSLALTYPYPVTSMAYPMVWQADTGMRYRMLGGYAIGRGADGSGTYFADPNPVEFCLIQIYTTGAKPPSLCDPAAMASALRVSGVTSVIAGAGQPHIGTAVSALRAALGAPPRLVGGVWLWQCSPTPQQHRCRWR
jgi:hypothetical protein